MRQWVSWVMVDQKIVSAGSGDDDDNDGGGDDGTGYWKAVGYRWS